MATMVVYAIHNSVNGKRYIGRTYNPHLRWIQHKSELRRGIHRISDLQSDWNELGSDTFEMLILSSSSDWSVVQFDNMEREAIRSHDASSLYNRIVYKHRSYDLSP